MNPNIRMEVCAGYTLWDLEGVNAIEIMKVLLGNKVKL